MSQNVTDIAAEILEFVNRTDVLAPRVLKVLNRVKRDVQEDGSPLDFMKHTLACLMGSGTGLPGDWTSFLTGRQNSQLSAILLPPNFHQLIYVEIVTDPLVSDADALTIFTTNEEFYHPTVGTTPNKRPLFAVYQTWSSDIGWTGDGATIVPDILSIEQGSYNRTSRATQDVSLTDDSVTNENPKCFVTESIGTINPALLDLDLTDYDYTSAAPLNGVPWSGKVLRFRGLPALSGVPYVFVHHYRILPDYAEASLETVAGTTPTEDIFTRTFEWGLICGAMAQLAPFEFDPRTGEGWDALYQREKKKFRRAHLQTQLSKGNANDHRLAPGTRLSSIYGSSTLLTR